MSKTQVKVNGTKDASGNGFFREIEGKLDRIRQSAFSLFQSRERNGDSSLDDWLHAENDLFDIPAGELTEDESSYALKVSAPGFKAGQLSVAVEPNWVTIQGKAEQRKDKAGEYSAVAQKELFRRFEFSSPIDEERVKAHFEDGMLSVVMPKASAAEQASSAESSPRKRASAHAA
jgi:HSP20 family molecular chaperone IbpA